MSDPGPFVGSWKLVGPLLVAPMILTVGTKEAALKSAKNKGGLNAFQCEMR